MWPELKAKTEMKRWRFSRLQNSPVRMGRSYPLLRKPLVGFLSRGYGCPQPSLGKVKADTAQGQRGRDISSVPLGHATSA